MIVTVLEILVGGFLAVFVSEFAVLVGFALLTSPPKKRARLVASKYGSSPLDLGG